MNQKKTYEELGEFTEAETDRQDIVDSACYNIVLELTGKTAEEVEWDMEWIGEIREIVQEVVCDKLKLMTEMEFHPYREI